VGDAAGQHTHSLHFLGLAELFFEAAALRHIHQDSETGFASTVCYFVDRSIDVNQVPAFGAVHPKAWSAAVRHEAARFFVSQDAAQIYASEFLRLESVEGGRRVICFEDFLSLQIEDQHRLRVIQKKQPESSIFISQQPFGWHRALRSGKTEKLLPTKIQTVGGPQTLEVRPFLTIRISFRQASTQCHTSKMSL
jgi:hypothetical protein